MVINRQFPRWINHQGMIVRPLNQAQQDYVATPVFQLALALYLSATQKNLPSAANRLVGLNRMINQYADEVAEANEPEAAANSFFN